MSIALSSSVMGSAVLWNLISSPYNTENIILLRCLALSFFILSIITALAVSHIDKSLRIRMLAVSRIGFLIGQMFLMFEFTKITEIQLASLASVSVINHITVAAVVLSILILVVTASIFYVAFMAKA